MKEEKFFLLNFFVEPFIMSFILKISWQVDRNTIGWVFVGNSSFITPLPLYCENLPAYDNSAQGAKPKIAQSDSGNESIRHSVGTQLLKVSCYNLLCWSVGSVLIWYAVLVSYLLLIDNLFSFMPFSSFPLKIFNTRW